MKTGTMNRFTWEKGWILCICVMLMLLLNSSVMAQRTVNVSQGVGTLNEAIESDTLSNGERVDSSTVYVLSRGGLYLLDGSIEHRDYHLTIVAEDGDGARPRLIPAVDTGGDSSRPFRPRGDLTIRGLYVTGQDELGGFNTRIVRISENDVTITVDDCHLDKDGQSAFRVDGDGVTLNLTNSIVSNIGTTGDANNGRVLDDRGNPMKSVYMENNTFYNITSQVIRDDGGVIERVVFNQNTVVNVAANGTLEFGPAVHTEMKDNLMINPTFYGQSATDGPRYVVALDSLTEDELNEFGTQTFVASNNNIHFTAGVIAAYPDSVSVTTKFNPTVAAFVEETGTAGSFTDELVTFTSGPAEPAGIITAYWADTEPPAFDTANEPFDFGYTNSFASFTGGTEGQQLGSLRWHGDIFTSNERVEEVPGRFTLHGNYPNPFNPTTNISFSLPVAANVQIDVFNVVGQKVMTVPVQQFQAGVNQNIAINAVTLSSGIYIYRITATAGSREFIQTGKMTLLK